VFFLLFFFYCTFQNLFRQQKPLYIFKKLFLCFFGIENVKNYQLRGDLFIDKRETRIGGSFGQTIP